MMKIIVRKNTEYIYHIKNGEKYYYSTYFIPLILWSFLVIKFYFLNKYIKHNISILILIFISIPYIYTFFIIYSAYINKTTDVSTIKLPPSWEICFDIKNITPEEKKIGILGKYNYRCAGNHLTQLKLLINNVTNRVYYINSAVFIIVLFIYNSIYHNLFENILFSNWIIICLLTGTLTLLISIFSRYHFISFVLFNIALGMLTLNICSFGITLCILFYLIM